MNNNTSAAIETLLYRNGLSEKDIQDAFALFSGYNIDYADFYFQRSVSEGYVLEESIVKTGHYNTDIGVGVRAVCGEKSALAYSEEISRDSLFEAVRTVRAIAQATNNQITVMSHLRTVRKFFTVLLIRLKRQTRTPRSNFFSP